MPPTLSNVHRPVKRVGPWQMWSAPEDDSDTTLTHNATVRARAGFTVQAAVNHYNTREGSEGELDGAPTRRQWQPDTMRHLIEHRLKPWKPADPAMRQTATVWKGVYPQSSSSSIILKISHSTSPCCPTPFLSTALMKTAPLLSSTIVNSGFSDAFSSSVLMK